MSFHIIDCYEYNRDYSGYDIEAVGDVPTIRACQIECEADPRCDFFTYAPNDNNGWCMFKSSDSGKTYFNNKHSGPKRC